MTEGAGHKRETDPALEEWLGDVARAAYCPDIPRSAVHVDRLGGRQHLYSRTQDWLARWPWGARRLVVKAYDNRHLTDTDVLTHLRSEYTALQTLWPLYLEESGLEVPRPLGYLGAESVLAMERVDGVPLDRALNMYPLRGGGVVSRAVERCGEWLARLHDATESSVALAEGLTRVLSELERDAERCVQVGLPPALVEEAAGDVRRAAPAAVQRGATAGCHGDFGPGNVLTGGGGIAVVDFTFYRQGLSFHDLAYFMGCLEFLLGPRFRQSLHHRLLRGYTARRALDVDALHCIRVAKMLTLAAWAPTLEPGGSLPRRMRRVGQLALLTRWLRRNIRERG